MTNLDQQQTLFKEAVSAASPLRLASSSGINVQSWHVSPQNVAYQNDDFHTLSLYLAGGQNSYRRDKKSECGAPGKLCIMPQSHSSHWAVRDDITFLHVYVPHRTLQQFQALNSHKDIRICDVQDSVYNSNQTLVEIIKQYQLSLNSGYALLTCEQLEHELLYSLMNNHTSTHSQTDLIGGLSPTNLKKTGEYIQDNISENITIHGMASYLNISPYHFAKMFKVSLGLSPAQYVLQKRLEKAIQLLSNGVSPRDASAQAGFSHQSHMTTVFKRVYQKTPGQAQSELYSE